MDSTGVSDFSRDAISNDIQTGSCTITQHRLVHLDLKGAPPKLTYFEKIFPLLSKWGATGLLVEYEDMFPYVGMCQDISAVNCYSAQEIAQLLMLAEQNDLEVIPLVQTFGHFEFVLKHEKFHKLREVSDYPMSLCPAQPDAVVLVANMVDQVIASHPSIKWFHIGADEVYHLGICTQCKKLMQSENMTPVALFFWYITKVLDHLHQNHAGIKPIMWDDMFRCVELNSLKESGLTGLVEPMVWLYTRAPFNLPDDIWDRYSSVFVNIWVASAFKGATGPCMFVTDISYHLDNHQEWIKVVNEELIGKNRKFCGFCLTGWQRYDHYSVLCELLPAALPSLALCLMTVSQGHFSEDIHRQVSTDLNFLALVPLNPFHNVDIIPQCDFPGSDIYIAMLMLLLHRTIFNEFIKHERLTAWMNRYHIKYKHANPVHILNFLPGIKQLYEHFQHVKMSLERSLSAVYCDDTVEEWIMCNVEDIMDQLLEITSNAEQLIQHGARPKSVQR